MRYLELPYISIDETSKWRYILLFNNGTIQSSNINILNTFFDGFTILFLGSDVISSASTLSSNNYSRVHKKFVDLNLDTKVLVENNCCIKGIPNGSSLWFYNIQAVFKVAFEYSNLAIQKYCLTNLKHIWLEYSKNPVMLNATTLWNPLKEHEKETLDVLEFNNEYFENRGIDENNICVDNIEYLEEEIIEFGDDDFVTNNENNKFNYPNAERKSYVDDDDEKNVLINDKTVEDSRSTNTPHVATESSFCKCVDASNLSDKFLIENVENIQYLHPCTSSNNYTTKENIPLPFSILKNQIETGFLNTSNTSDHEDTFNNVTSNSFDKISDSSVDRLLKYFSQIKDKILSNATKFKLLHLQNVNELPIARTIVFTIFPVVMIQLVARWMQLDLEAADDWSFSLLQIILEFLNGVFISGTAHVLYAKIKCSQGFI